MKCPKCQCEYQAGDKFYPKCGAKLGEFSKATIPKLEDMILCPENLGQVMLISDMLFLK